MIGECESGMDGEAAKPSTHDMTKEIILPIFVIIIIIIVIIAIIAIIIIIFITKEIIIIIKLAKLYITFKKRNYEAEA